MRVLTSSLSALNQDLRYAWRSLRATPRLTAAASACAALGLAAAIFMTSLAHTVLLSAPPIPDSARLVRLWTASTSGGQTSDISFPEYLDVRARAASFDAVEAAARTRLAVTTGVGTERLRGESVTPGYFALIGVRPAVGRLFTPDEHAADADRTVLISHDLWLRRFGGRPDIVGQLFRARPTMSEAVDRVRTIIGVMPQNFVGTVDPDVSDFWVPVAHYEPARVMADRLTRSVWAIARLREGVSMPAARAEVAAISTRLASEHPAAYDRVTLVTEPFGESWRARFRLSLFTLLAAAVLLLLIACANVGALLLARIGQRENELVVRAALGAPRARLRRQLLMESLIIALAGGAAGLAIASASLRAIAAANLFALPPYVELVLNPTAAMTGLLMVLVTGLGFGLLPASRGAAASSPHGVTASARILSGARERRAGRLLTAMQVAFTFMLLVGATLLFRTYQHLVGGDLGFRTDHLLRLALTPDPNQYRDAATRLALAADIKRTLDACPGVRASAVQAGVLPPWFDDVVDVEIDAATSLRDVGRHAIGPDYLGVMGMAVVSGRSFDASDRAAGARSALVSATLAARLASAGRPAIGQQVRLVVPGMAGAELIDVVGVVNDVQYHGPLRPRPADHDVYVPLERSTSGPFSVAVHTDVDPATLIEPLSRELGRLAPTSPQHWISTMEGELGLQYRDARLYASLSGAYGAAAALIASLGIYSVLANHVTRRRREIGLRLAIGARPADIVRLVLLEGARTLTVGLVAGAVLAALTTRLLEGLLYGVVPGDTVTFVVVGAILLAAGLAACALPSLRAGRVDPLIALRST